MAQEDRSNSSSGGGGIGGGGAGCSGSGNGGGGNRSSKKLKQKKVPQRGLGVAQLEKIRLEEQQKKEAATLKAATTILPPNSIISASNSSSSLGIQCPNFRPNIPPAPIPLPPPPPPPPLPPDLRSPNPIYKPAPLIPNVDHLRPNSVPFSKPMNVGGGEIGWSRNLGSGHGNWPRLWNGEYNVQGENHRLDQHWYEYRPNMIFPYDSNARVWPLPNVVQRSQQFQQPSSSSMMEPPSNQSYSGSNYTNSWPEEEKMVGMKRPYPFSVDNAPGPSFNSKFPPVYVSPISGPDESAPCTNGGSINIEPANPILRENPLSSSSMSEPNQRNVTKENGGLNGEFLTLAPPATAQPHSSSKQKYLSPYLSQLSRELPEFDILPYQGITEDRTRSPGLGGSTQQPFFSFFPLAKTQNDQAATTTSNNSDDAAESVDLNLTL